ncbi:MAG: hypothetical protein ACR2FN_00040 [Chitinophagaceae bacterium]
MKKIVAIIVMLLFTHLSQAQTWAEWFQQKKTQKKYLLQQIAALQVYLDYAKKGYDIVSKGLNTIYDIKDGEFNLHETFFNSLKSVNPKIKNAVEVAEIISIQISIVNHFKAAIKMYNGSNQFNNSELNYINNVYSSLIVESLKDIDQLMEVITDDKLEMTDDERINQINNIYSDMCDKNQFTQSFTNGASLLAQQRARDQNDATVSKELYGLH